MSQELGAYLAALRAENLGYGSSFQENGVTVFGAYGMLLENWREWSDEAGYRGADPTDPSAQDAVAGYWASKFHQRYGNWGLVSAAWFAGQDQADDAYQSGIDIFHNQRISAFQNRIEAAQVNLEGSQVPVAARRWVNMSPTGKWLSPIAGQSEYSGGSWMPNTRTHRGRVHPAIDVYADRGTPVVAPVSGKVLKSGWNDKGGNTITILGNDGIKYYFAHMDQPSHVAVGTQLGAGSHIGNVGNTGSAKNTKPHVHLSMTKGGAYVNPKAFLDGSMNASGYFEASGTPAMAMDESPGANLDRTLEATANAMSGDQDRIDPRTIGLPPEKPESGEGPY
jgi:hypothetical protein